MRVSFGSQPNDELELAKRRYDVHPLTRTFAKQRLELEPRFDQQAFERMLAHYKRLVTPPTERIGVPYWDGLANYTRTEELEPEWENLALVIRRALEEGRSTEALNLFLPLVHLLHMWDLWDQRLQLSRELCRVASELEKPTVAWLWIDAIGHILRKRQRLSEFHEALENGKELARQYGLEDALLLADVFQAKATTDDLDRAQEMIASVIGRMNGDVERESTPSVRSIIVIRAFETAGSLDMQQQNYARAKSRYERALKLRQLTGDTPVPVFSVLASINLELGAEATAEQYLNQASAQANRKDWAWIYFGRARLAERQGHWHEALDFAQLANERFTRREHKRGLHECRKLLERLPKPIKQD